MLRADLRETCWDWDPWEAGGPCLRGSKQPGLAWAVRALALSPSDHAPSGGGFLPLHWPVAVSDSSRGASGRARPRPGPAGSKWRDGVQPAELSRLDAASVQSLVQPVSGAGSFGGRLWV